MKGFLLLCLLIVATYQTSISSVTGFIKLDSRALEGTTSPAGALDFFAGTTLAATAASSGFSVPLPLSVDDGIVKTATGKALSVKADKELKVTSTGKTSLTATAATSVFTFTVGTTLQGTAYPANFTAPTALITSAVWSAASKDLSLTALNNVQVKAATGKWAEFRFAATVYQRLGATSLTQLEGDLQVVGKDDVTFRPSASVDTVLSGQDGTKKVTISDGGVKFEPALTGVSTGNGLVANAGKDLAITGTGGVSISTTAGTIAVSGDLVDKTTKGFTAAAGQDLVLKAPATFAVRTRSGTDDSLVSMTGVVTVPADVAHKTLGLSIDTPTAGGDLTLAATNAAAKVSLVVGTATVSEAEKTKVSFGPATGASTNTIAGAANLGGALTVSGAGTFSAAATVDGGKKISGDNFTLETTGNLLTFSALGTKKATLSSGTTTVLTALDASVTLAKDLTTGTGATTLAGAVVFDENVTLSAATVTGAGALTLQALATGAHDLVLNGKTGIDFKINTLPVLNVSATGFSTPAAVKSTFQTLTSAGKVTFNEAAVFTNLSMNGKLSAAALELVSTQVTNITSDTGVVSLKVSGTDVVTLSSTDLAFKQIFNITSQKLKLKSINVGSSTADFKVASAGSLAINGDQQEIIFDSKTIAAPKLSIKAANVDAISATFTPKLVTVNLDYTGLVNFSTRPVVSSGTVTATQLDAPKIEFAGEMSFTPAAGKNFSYGGTDDGSQANGKIGAINVFAFATAATTIAQPLTVSGAGDLVVTAGGTGGVTTAAAFTLKGKLNLPITTSATLNAGTDGLETLSTCNKLTFSHTAAADINIIGSLTTLTAGSVSVAIEPSASITITGLTSQKPLRIAPLAQLAQAMKIAVVAKIVGTKTVTTTATAFALCDNSGADAGVGVIVASDSVGGDAVTFFNATATGVRICTAQTGGTLTATLAANAGFRFSQTT